MIKTKQDEIIQIINEFCNIHGINKEDLSIKNKHKNGKKKKVINGVNVAVIRIGLGDYFTTKYPLSLTEAVKLIGYNDHSTISNNNQKIYFYIKNNDKYFMSYYNVLEQIGSKYEQMKFIRIGQKAIYA